METTVCVCWLTPDLSLTTDLWPQRELTSALRPLQEKLEALNTVKQTCEESAEHIKVRRGQKASDPSDRQNDGSFLALNGTSCVSLHWSHILSSALWNGNSTITGIDVETVDPVKVHYHWYQTVDLVEVHYQWYQTVDPVEYIIINIISWATPNPAW